MGQDPERRVTKALDMIRADDMRLLLGMKRPPEMVKKVTTPSLLLASRPRHATVAGHNLTNLCAPLSPWPSLAPHVFSLFV